jgi:hypothetical protein
MDRTNEFIPLHGNVARARLSTELILKALRSFPVVLSRTWVKLCNEFNCILPIGSSINGRRRACYRSLISFTCYS